MIDRLPPLDDETRRGIEEIANRHEVGLLEAAARMLPDDLCLLVRLGELYSLLGRVRDGLAVDQQLVQIAPADPIVRYNLACSLARSGRTAEAVAALKEAVRLGYTDFEHLLADDDLAAVRDDAGFALVLDLMRRQEHSRQD